MIHQIIRSKCFPCSDLVRIRNNGYLILVGLNVPTLSAGLPFPMPCTLVYSSCISISTDHFHVKLPCLVSCGCGFLRVRVRVLCTYHLMLYISYQYYVNMSNGQFWWAGVVNHIYLNTYCAARDKIMCVRTAWMRRTEWYIKLVAGVWIFTGKLELLYFNFELIYSVFLFKKYTIMFAFIIRFERI